MCRRNIQIEFKFSFGPMVFDRVMSLNFQKNEKKMTIFHFPLILKDISYVGFFH